MTTATEVLITIFTSYHEAQGNRIKICLSTSLNRGHLRKLFFTFFTTEEQRTRRKAYELACLRPCSICAETSAFKRLSAVTRALLKAVSGGNEHIAKVPFFDSFLGMQERMKYLL